MWLHFIKYGLSTDDAEHLGDKISNQPVNASANMYNIFAFVTRRSFHHYNRIGMPSETRYQMTTSYYSSIGRLIIPAV